MSAMRPKIGDEFRDMKRQGFPKFRVIALTDKGNAILVGALYASVQCCMSPDMLANPTEWRKVQR